MQQYIQFISNNWLLVTAFAVVLVLFMLNELYNLKFGICKLSSAQAVDLMNRHDAVVIDLRSGEDFKQGHILGARNMPHAELSQKMTDSDLKQRAIILVCQNGQQSFTSGNQLQKEGFVQVASLAGGMAAWQNESMPIVKE